MSNQFQVIVDFLVKVQNDPASLNKLTKDLNKNLKDINPKVNLNTEEVKKGAKAINNILSDVVKNADDIKIDLDTKKAKKEVDDLAKAFNGIKLDRLDNELKKMTDFEDAAKNLENALNNADAGEVTKFIKELGPAYEQAKNEAQALVDQNKSALDAMKAMGKDGTDAYRKLEAEIAKGEQTLEKFTGEMENISLEKVVNEFEKINDIDVSGLADDLQKAFDSGDSDQIAKAMQTYNQEASKAEQELTEFISKNKKTLAVLKNTGAEGSKAYNTIEKEIQEAEKKLLNFGDALEDNNQKSASFADRMATLGLAAQGIQTVADGFSSLSNGFVQLDTATQKIKTLGGAAKDIAPELSEASLEMSNLYGIAAEDIQLGNYDALSAGINATIDDMGAFGNAAAQLAVGGQESFGNAVDILSSQVNAYGLEATEAARVSDILFNTVNLGKTSIPELSSSLANVVPTAAAAGVELDQVGAALAQMTAKGIPTAQSTTKLNALLIELQKPGAALKPILEEAGVSLESLANEDVTTNLGNIKQALEDAGVAATQAFSSSEAGSAFNVLTGDIEGLQENLDGVRFTTGSTAAAFEDMSNGVQNQIDVITNNFKNLITQGVGALGDSFVVLTQSASQLAPIATTFLGIHEAIPQKTLDKFNSSFLDFRKNVSSFSAKDFNGKLSSMGKGIGSLGTKMGGIGGIAKGLGPLLVNPWVIGGLALGAFLTQTEEGQQVLDSLGSQSGDLLEALKPLGDFFKKVLAENLKLVGESLINLGSAIFHIVEPIVSLLGMGIGAFFGMFTGGAQDATEASFGMVDVLTAVPKILSIVTKGIELLVIGIKGLVTNAGPLLEAFGDLAAAKLNPKAWFGDTEAEKEAEAKFAQVLQRSLSGAVDKVNTTVINKTIENAVSIKGDIDKNKKIQSFLDEYNNATDEMEKNQIAEKIQEQLPGLQSGFKTVRDESGKLVQVIDLNTEKVKELTDANEQAYQDKFITQQERFNSNLLAQSQAYADNKKRIDEITNQILEGVEAGADVSSLKAEYDALQTEVQDQAEKLSENLDDAVKLGFDVSEVKFDESFERDFTGQLTELTEIANKANLGEKLSASLRLKGKIDKQDKIGELVSDYEKASDEIEKANIAKKIANQAPELAKANGTIEDSNGKLIENYEIATGKVDEYVAKQKEIANTDLNASNEEFVNDLISEAQKYNDFIDSAKIKKNEVDDLFNQGLDFSEANKSYELLNSKAESSRDAILDYFLKAEEQGLVTADSYVKVADSLGLSEEEFKNVLAEQKKSNDLTDDQVEGVTKLEEKWKDVTKGLKDSVEQQVLAINDIKLQLRNKDLNDEERDALNEQLKLAEGKASADVKRLKSLEKINKQTRITLGLEEASGKSSLEIAKEIASLKTTDIDLDLQAYEIKQKTIALEDDSISQEALSLDLSTKKLESAKNERDIYAQILKTRGLISEYDAETGEIIINPKIKKTDRQEIRKMFQDFQSNIEDSEAAIVEVQVKIDAENFDIRQQLNALNERQLEYNIEIGVIDNTELQKLQVANLKTTLDRVEKELELHNNEIKKLEDEKFAIQINPDLTDEQRRLQLQKNNIELNEELKAKIEKENIILDSNTRIFQIEKSAFDDRIKLIKDQEERATKETEALYSAEINNALNQQEKLKLIQQGRLTSNEDSAILSIERQNEKELELLQDKFDNGVIAEQSYEDEKTRIMEEGERKRQEIQEKYENLRRIQEATSMGYSLELETNRQTNLAQIQRNSAEAQLKELENDIKNRENSELELLKYEEFKQAQLDYLNAVKEARQNANREEAQEQVDASKAILDQKLSQLNANDQELAAQLTESLKNSGEILDQNSNIILASQTQLQEGVENSIGNLFAGNIDEAKQNMKDYLGLLAGMLQAKGEAKALDLILSDGVTTYLNKIPFPGNVVALGAATAIIKTAFKKLTDPIIGKILSFSTGGRVDQPTVFQAGDASNLGGPNREWIFRDDQLQKLVKSVRDANSERMLQQISQLNQTFSGLRFTSSLGFDEVSFALESYNTELEQRGFG